MEKKIYLNRYQVRHDAKGAPIELRRSPNGVTYQADDFTLHREVALEVVSAAAITPEMRTKLEADANAAQQLNHINIPRLHDFGFENDQLIYATEYHDGTSAEAWVTEHGPMPAGAVLRIALQAVNALGAATFHGSVHHAINPKAVMLVPGQTTDGEWPLIKVQNLIGVAPPTFANVTGATAVFESAAQFASPEQLQQGTVDFRSGIYSLGCTLWFLLTGAVPANGAITRVSGVSKSVTQLVGEMISPDPMKRAQDPLALQERIRGVLSNLDRREALGRKIGLSPGAAAAPVPVAVAEGEAPPRRAIPIVPLAIAAGILALAAFGALMIPESLRPRQIFGGGEIGVPIGIPEPAANAVANNAASATQTPLGVAPQTPAPSQPALAEEPRVAANAPSAAATSSSIPPAAPVVTENAVAANAPAATAPPTLESEPEPAQSTVAAAEDVASTEAPVIAANTAAPSVESTEPAPPAEGPSTVRAQQAPPPPVDTSVARVSREPETKPATAVAPAVAEKRPAAQPKDDAEERETIARAEAQRRAKLTASAKRNQTSAARARSKLAANQPRRALPRGRVRAEYLGTTPEGELIFGMPMTNERVYAAPPADPYIDERRPRQIRRALPPVLPALPPDEPLLDADDEERDDDEG